MVATKLRLLSADSHIFEPPDLWTSRIEKKYRGRAPHIVRGEDADWWFVEKDHPLGSIGNSTHAGERYRQEDPDVIALNDRWESMRPGAYDPHEAIKDMDDDGVEGAAIFPTLGVGGLWRAVDDLELLSAIFRTYNEWIAEFCKPYPERLKGMAMINLDNIQDGVDELHRAKKSLGLHGAIITVSPPHERQYDSPEYDPFWQAAQELDMPLCLHSGSNRTLRDGIPMDAHAPMPHESMTVVYCNTEHWIRRSITVMISGGVLERFPGLKVVSVENYAGWAPFFLLKMDLLYRDRGERFGWPRFKDNWKPSDFFHRNVSLTFQEDWLAVKNRALIGVESLVWGSDYPHTEGTWPESQRVVREIFSDVSAEELHKITYSQTAKLFNFGPPEGRS